MRFMVTGEWKKNSLLRLVLILFLFFVTFFWVTSLLLYFHSMSLDPQTVVAHYLGKKSSWGPAVPRSYKVMLEVSHAHFAMIGIWLLTVAHLLLFIPISGRWKALGITVCMLSGLLNELSGWLIRYVHPHFAYLKISMFLLLQISTFLIILSLVFAIIFGWRNAYRDSERGKKSDE